MAKVKRDVKSKVAAKEWLWWANLLVMIFQVNLVPNLSEGNTNSPELLLLIFCY